VNITYETNGENAIFEPFFFQLLSGVAFLIRLSVTTEVIVDFRNSCWEYICAVLCRENGLVNKQIEFYLKTQNDDCS